MLSTHNVPGALSSSSRRDFKAVLEAFADAEVPMPGSGRWANAGMVRGRGVDLAWCVYDAQYFGTAQRRRRIFLVADLRGERAGEILFVPKSLSGYFAAGGTPRQGLAAYAQNGAGTAGAGIDGYNAQTPRSKQILVCCEEFVPLHIMSTSLSLLFAFYSVYSSSLARHHRIANSRNALSRKSYHCCSMPKKYSLSLKRRNAPLPRMAHASSSCIPPGVKLSIKSSMMLYSWISHFVGKR